MYSGRIDIAAELQERLASHDKEEGDINSIGLDSPVVRREIADTYRVKTNRLCCGAPQRCLCHVGLSANARPGR